MNPALIETIVAIAIVAMVIGLTIWIRRYRAAAASKRRMMSMMRRVGLDPEIATYGDGEAIIQAVRRRCKRCASEELCERWLAGEEEGPNNFCPNADVFEFLKRAGESRR
jgi:type VI protein secretion system component VasK